MALLAVFQPNPLARARIATALAGVHELVPFSDWGTFFHALETMPADGCLLDPYQPGQPVELAEIQRLRERHPALAIVVHGDFKGPEMDLYTLGRLRIDGVVPAAKWNGGQQMRETISEALASSVASRVVASLSPRLPQLALDCLKWSIENSHRNPTAEELAEPFAPSSRSLSRMLRKAGAPSPVRILLWGRLFRAAHMLTDGCTTVEQAAFSLGYSSGAALARALRRETGYPPGELLRRGGIGCVLDGFAWKEIKPLPARSAPAWRSSGTTPAPRPSKGPWS